MKIAELGLNHLGNIRYLNNYLNKLEMTNVDAITCQILDKSFFINNNMNSYYIDNDYLLKSLIAFKKKTKKKIGIATQSDLIIDIIKNYKINFVKILSVSSNNYKVLEAFFKRTNYFIYISVGLSKDSDLKKMLKYFNKYKKRIGLIHTNFNPHINNTNLSRINYLKNKFHKNVSFGLHCKNHLPLSLSPCFGATNQFFYIKGSSVKIHPDQDHAIFIKDINITIEQIANSYYSI